LVKFRIIELGTGLRLLLTEYYVGECIQSVEPKVLMRKFLVSQLEKLAVGGNFRPLDIEVLVEFHLNNLYFCLKSLKLLKERACVLLNIFWAVLRNQDARYEEQKREIIGSRLTLE